MTAFPPIAAIRGPFQTHPSNAACDRWYAAIAIPRVAKAPRGQGWEPSLRARDGASTSKGNAWKAAIVPETRPEFPFPPEGPLNFCPEPRPSRREARGGGGLGTLMPLLASGASATCLR